MAVLICNKHICFDDVMIGCHDWMWLLRWSNSPLYRSSPSQTFHSPSHFHQVKTSTWPKPSLPSWSLMPFIWSPWFPRWQEPSASAARWITHRSFTMTYVSWWRKRSASDTVWERPWIRSFTYGFAGLLANFIDYTFDGRMKKRSC